MIPFSLPLITRIKHQGSYTTLQRKEKHELEEPSSAFAASLMRAQTCQEHILKLCSWSWSSWDAEQQVHVLPAW